ncbi:MAG: hypothetical protein K0B02_05495 [DPANN group archaeon]|nr:hypothetical protein [DPANN group archaeon]
MTFKNYLHNIFHKKPKTEINNETKDDWFTSTKSLFDTDQDQDQIHVTGSYKYQKDPDTDTLELKEASVYFEEVIDGEKTTITHSMTEDYLDLRDKISAMPKNIHKLLYHIFSRTYKEERGF